VRGIAIPGLALLATRAFVRSSVSHESISGGAAYPPPSLNRTTDSTPGDYRLCEAFFAPAGGDVRDPTQQQDHGAARRAGVELGNRSTASAMAAAMVPPDVVPLTASRALPAALCVRLRRGAQHPSTNNEGQTENKTLHESSLPSSGAFTRDYICTASRRLAQTIDHKLFSVFRCLKLSRIPHAYRDVDYISDWRHGLPASARPK
jgi:hypothetical protein